MPKGVPKNGYRKTSGYQGAAAATLVSPLELRAARPSESLVDLSETDEQIEERIGTRFKIMNTMARATALGANPSFIISGPPGLGKSFGVTQILEGLQDEGKIVATFISGFTRATGLYKSLYRAKDPANVIVFDDADSAFMDDTSLNLLKVACDSTKTRHVSWMAETRMETDEGEPMPTRFEFEGSIIFITNLDFDELIARGTRLAPHLEAFISRAHYLDLALKSKRDYMVRIKQVMRMSMAKSLNLSSEESAQIINYMDKNSGKIRELSLRMAQKIARLIKMSPSSWSTIADATCLR